MERKEYARSIVYDLLRIISAFGIVVLHVASAYIDRNPVTSIEFRVANFYDSLSRFGIGMFVMISGAIFLSEKKETSVKKLWTGNILRMFIVYVVWSFIYFLIQSLYYWKYDFWKDGILAIVRGCAYSSEHFWFLFMIMGLYALIPVLKTWLSHAKTKEIDYFIKLFVVFQVIRTTITILVDKDLANRISEMVSIVELSRYLGYFVIGYALTHFELAQKTKIAIYGMVPIGICVNYFVSDMMSRSKGVYSPGIYDSFGWFTFIITIALFIFVKDQFEKKEISSNVHRIVGNVAKDTLGIYLMHMAILNYISSKGWLFIDLPSAIGVPVISLLVFATCGLAAEMLRRIPVIGRYLA